MEVPWCEPGLTGTVPGKSRDRRMPPAATCSWIPIAINISKKSEAIDIFIDFQTLSSVMSIGGMRLCAVLLVTLVNKIRPPSF